MYTVYLLRSESTGKLYTGQTANLGKRLVEHNSGIARYTRGRGPWLLIHADTYDTRAEAVKRERFLKSGQGRAWIKNTLMSQGVNTAESDIDI